MTRRLLVITAVAADGSIGCVVVVVVVVAAAVVVAVFVVILFGVATCAHISCHMHGCWCTGSS